MRKLHLGRLPVIIFLLVLIDLIGQGLFQVFIVDVPKPTVYYLNAANLIQLLSGIATILLLVNSNTRRPEGIDPNIPRGRDPDPFGMDTEALLHEGIQLPDGKPYGRRKFDDPAVVARLTSSKTEDQAVNPPAWVKAVGVIASKLPDTPPEPSFHVRDLDLELVTEDKPPPLPS